MRGLDPRIHPLEKEILTTMMDGRVKPGHDTRLDNGPLCGWPFGSTYSRVNRVVLCMSASRTISFGDHSSIVKDWLRDLPSATTSRCSSISRSIAPPPVQFSVRRISNIGRANGRLILSSRQIRTGAISMMRSRNSNGAVMHGLDPRIHPLEKEVLAKMMDGRVIGERKRGRSSNGYARP